MVSAATRQTPLTPIRVEVPQVNMHRFSSAVTISGDRRLEPPNGFEEFGRPPRHSVGTRNTSISTTNLGQQYSSAQSAAIDFDQVSIFPGLFWFFRKSKKSTNFQYDFNTLKHQTDEERLIKQTRSMLHSSCRFPSDKLFSTPKATAISQCNLSTPNGAGSNNNFEDSDSDEEEQFPPPPPMEAVLSKLDDVIGKQVLKFSNKNLITN